MQESHVLSEKARLQAGRKSVFGTVQNQPAFAIYRGRRSLAYCLDRVNLWEVENNVKF